MMDPEKFDNDHLDPLRSLTSDGIANVLRAKGITGQRSAAESCPIAVWLRDVTGAQWSSASTHVLMYGPANPTPGVQIPRVATPDSIFAFIQVFDKGCYPDLED